MHHGKDGEPRMLLSEGQKSSDNIYIYSREREGGREGLTSKCDIVSSHSTKQADTNNLRQVGNWN